MSTSVSNLSLWSVLRENAALILMYVLGAILAALLWWSLALVYVGYCILSNVLYMAWICPYCPHYAAGTCPAGYHIISQQRFKPAAGKAFAGQFNLGVMMLAPGWFLPSVIGLYLVFARFSWGVVVLLALFCVIGFWILPTDSQRHCEGCDNEDCPRRKRKPAASGETH